MKFRTLLLGTAAAFGIVGGAQAADLAVAEAIDYVKVCDAFGTGYFYSPGTDTCIKISGYVKINGLYYSDDKYLNFSHWDSSGVAVYDDYYAPWQLKTEGSVTVTGQTMTDLGPAVAFIDIRAVSTDDNYKGANKLAYFDAFYLKIGPVQAGRFASVFDHGGSFTDGGSIRHDKQADQVAFGWNMGGWALWFGVEDARYTGGGSGYYTGDMPALALKVVGGWDGVEVAGSVGVSDTIYGTGWGAQLVGTATFGNGDKIRVAGAVSNDHGAQYTRDTTPMTGGGTWWSAYITGQHFWTSAFSSAVTFAYADGPSALNATWNLNVGGYLDITQNTSAGLEFQYNNTETAAGWADSWTVWSQLKVTY